MKIQLSRRQRILNEITICSSKDDLARATRLLLENRISKDSFDKAWQTGQTLKLAIEKRNAAKKITNPEQTTDPILPHASLRSL